MPHSKGFRSRGDARSGEPVPIGDVVDWLLSEELFSRGLPIAKLAQQWSRVVGERLAAETAPAALEGGILTVAASNGPWGSQAKFLNEEIRRRANEALGGEPIRVVRVVVRDQRNRR